MSAPHLPPVSTALLSDISTSLQETTVSTLTSDSSFVDSLVDIGGGEDTQLLPLTSMFHCPFIEASANQNGKMSWLCKWCGKMFSSRYQSWEIQHALKMKLGDVAICSSLIPKEYKDRILHCMSEAQNEWQQRSTPIVILRPPR